MDPTVLPSQSVFVGLGILLGFGSLVSIWGEKGDRIESLAIFGAAGVAGILGARLLWAFASPEGPLVGGAIWWSVVDPSVPGFWSFGGLSLGGLTAWAASRQISGQKAWRRLDRVVPAGFSTLASARFGCLSAGCDFGRVTDFAWGLRYPSGTMAWHAHVDAGLVPAGSGWSLPTHPFPMYMVGVTLVAVVVGEIASRSLDRREGVQALVTAGCYLTGRILTEALRSPHAESVLRGAFLNVSQVLGAGGLGLLIIIAWIRRERR